MDAQAKPADTKENRHIIAEVRRIAGLTQSRLAALIGCSLPTIKAIELQKGALKLSERLAEKISLKTGVSITTLLNNDPTKPILDRGGDPFTKAAYESRIAKDHLSASWGADGRFSEVMLEDHYYKAAIQMGAVLRAAMAKDKGELAAYKMEKAVDEWRAEFGESLPENFFDGLALNSKRGEVFELTCKNLEREKFEDDQVRASIHKAKRQKGQKKWEKKVKEGAYIMGPPKVTETPGGYRIVRGFQKRKPATSAGTAKKPL